MKPKKAMRASITFYLATPIDAYLYASLMNKPKHRRSSAIRTMVNAGLKSMLEADGISRQYYVSALTLVSESPVEFTGLNLSHDEPEDAELLRVIYEETPKRQRDFVIRALVIAGYLMLNPSDRSHAGSVFGRAIPANGNISPAEGMAHVKTDTKPRQNSETRLPSKHEDSESMAGEDDQALNKPFAGGLIPYVED